MARDLIEIRGLPVSCVVGVYPHERDMPQELIVDVVMETSTEEAAIHERLRETLDYAAMAAQIAFLLENCKFRLLETAAHSLAKLLLAEPAPGEGRGSVESLRLTLTKPRALTGGGVPALTIERDAAWARASIRRDAHAWGSVDVIHETRDAGIYRISLAPGAAIAVRPRRVTTETEMIVSDGLLSQGRRAGLGSVRRWARSGARVQARPAAVYKNPTDRAQTVLCVGAPGFLSSAEIEQLAQ